VGEPNALKTIFGWSLFCVFKHPTFLMRPRKFKEFEELLSSPYEHGSGEIYKITTT